MLSETDGGVCRLIAGTSAEWQCADEDTQPRIYFANHASHLDFLLIWSALPAVLRRQVRPVAGKDYWDRNRVRRFVSSRIFHAVLIDRGAHEHQLTAARASIRSMAAELDRGYSLIVFPEGTRSRDGSIGRFKSGLFHLSRLRPDVDCVPVFVENAHRILPKGEALPVPMLSRVIFGRPIRAGFEEDKQAFLARARSTLLRLGGFDDRPH